MVRVVQFALAAGLFLMSPLRADAVAVRAGATTIAIATYTRVTAVGYDSVNRVYLVLGTRALTGVFLQGRFVDAAGTPLGAPFKVQASANFTHTPSVTFSRDADGGAGAFLVVWHEGDIPAGTSIHTRLVSYSRNGPVGADNVVSVDGSYWERYAGVAYSSVSREFLITYPRLIRGIRGVRVNLTGAALAAPFTIAANGEFEEWSAAAYNPANNQYVVTYEGVVGPIGNIYARAVQAGSDTLLGAAPTLLYQGGYNYINEIVYNSATNQFLAAWYRDSGGEAKNILGRVINPDMTLPGNVTVISSLWRAYDGLGLAYNPTTQTSFMVSHHGVGYEDGGVEVKTDGNPVDNGFLVTQHADTLGNFYPKIAASTDDPNWLMVTSHNFASTDTQMVAGTSLGPPAPVPNPRMSIDTPTPGSVLQQPFLLAGWAADLGSTTGNGADAIHVWAWPVSGTGAPVFVGAVVPTWDRPDVAAAFGSQFASSGFGLIVNNVPGGTYQLAAYMHSTVAATFNLAKVVTVTISDPQMTIDGPGNGSVVPANGFLVSGWSLDRGAATGTGVNTLHVWAFPVGGGAPIWAGVAGYGVRRDDVGAAYGAQFATSGYGLTITTLPPGTYDIVVFSQSSVTGTFNNARVVRVTVQ
jgi:hypothetical protein